MPGFEGEPETALEFFSSDFFLESRRDRVRELTT